MEKQRRRRARAHGRTNKTSEVLGLNKNLHHQVAEEIQSVCLTKKKHHIGTRKQSETADLRQRHVVRQVAALYSVWQRFPLCPTESNVNENFKLIQNPGFLSDQPKN